MALFASETLHLAETGTWIDLRHLIQGRIIVAISGVFAATAYIEFSISDPPNGSMLPQTQEGAIILSSDAAMYPVTTHGPWVRPAIIGGDGATAILFSFFAGAMS